MDSITLTSGGPPMTSLADAPTFGPTADHTYANGRAVVTRPSQMPTQARLLASPLDSALMSEHELAELIRKGRPGHGDAR